MLHAIAAMLITVTAIRIRRLFCRDSIETSETANEQTPFRKGAWYESLARAKSKLILALAIVPSKMQRGNLWQMRQFYTSELWKS
jgi:hypothetical protein